MRQTVLPPLVLSVCLTARHDAGTPAAYAADPAAAPATGHARVLFVTAR